MARFRLALLLVLGCLCAAPAPSSAQRSRKPTRRVIVLGHDTHGKSTLSAAITRILSAQGQAEFVPYEKLAHPAVISFQGVDVAATRLTYDTPKAHYVHVDCGNHNAIKKLLSEDRVKLDGAILVVSAVDGPMPQTAEQIRLARQHGVPAMVVFLNKVDVQKDPDLLQLVEKELRELLNRSGYSNVTIVRGSALNALNGAGQPGEASVRDLLAAMDRQFAP